MFTIQNVAYCMSVFDMVIAFSIVVRPSNEKKTVRQTIIS